MIYHRILHRFFFLSMFIVCAISVGLFIKGKVIGLDKVKTMPGTVLGDSIAMPSNMIPITTSLINKLPITTISNNDTSPKTTVSTPITTVSNNNTSPKTTVSVNNTSPITTVSNSVSETTTLNSRQGTTSIKNNATTTQLTVTEKNTVITTGEQTSINTGEINQQKNTETNFPKVEVNQSAVILAQDIPADNNPKISGHINKILEISAVNFSEDKDGSGKKIKLSGKALPNMFLTIYIFSDDPVVITVKTDENGNWNYELDKELADGKHEAYVAVTENSGKIIAKSEPIAFVKTAEAVSTIPVADLQSSQSPMVRSQSQYAMFAFVIIIICLLISLILIGIVTYKHHLNERIN